MASSIASVVRHGILFVRGIKIDFHKMALRGVIDLIRGAIIADTRYIYIY
jgi:hypothetical protein